ncbi:MAG: ribonuclease R [Gammaproteobacteria bacterium]
MSTQRKSKKGSTRRTSARQRDWRKWQTFDPDAERQAERYDLPIPSRRLLRDYFEQRAAPLALDVVASEFGLGGERKDALGHRLGAMCRDGELVSNRRNQFCLTRRLPVQTGTVLAHRDGFGFLSPDEGGDDVFLPPRVMRSLMHGDRASVRVQKNHDGRSEGRLVDVLERARTQLAGTYFREHGLSFVRPADPRIADDVLVPTDAVAEAKPGQMVTVELTAFPDHHSPAVGRVVEVLGDRAMAGMASELAVRNHDLPHVWPKAVLAEAEALPTHVRTEDCAGREDLRELPLVTIDGEDARDFDDALYCRPERDGFRLYVAIADVAHYVRRNSALDAEALNRGNSVYFPDRVIPMLPEALSNGLCSLNPDVDRLCMVAEMKVRKDGSVTRSRFYSAVMHSRARLTYTEVAAILVDGDKDARRKRESLIEHLEALHGVYRALAKERAQRGAIDFDSVEPRFMFGVDGHVSGLKPLVRNAAHRLVEECMIAANSAVAHRLSGKKIPALYRSHERPPADKLADLREFLGLHGLNLGGGSEPQPAHYAKLMRAIAQRPDRMRIETMLLRSLSQAMYVSDSTAHFGLALTHYAHFTSPIRRYPDLLVHRALKHLFTGEPAAAFAYDADEMQALGRRCSMTERRADEASREVADALKAEYMSSRVGEEFAGVVTGVTGFGLFVQLEDLFVEGLVHVTALSSDYYEFDSATQRLNGTRSGVSYAVGDRMQVRVARVSIEERKIDLVPATVELPAIEKRKKKRRRR